MTEIDGVTLLVIVTVGVIECVTVFVGVTVGVTLIVALGVGVTSLPLQFISNSISILRST